MRALLLMALVAACGKSGTETVCRSDRKSAANYLGVSVRMLETKTEPPKPVTAFEPLPPDADPDTALWETAIVEQNRLQVELVDKMIATANAREALREPAKKALQETAATLLDDQADAVTAARTALDYFAKLDAIDSAMAKDAGALAGKTAALRDRLDAKIAQGIKDPKLKEQISLTRSTADQNVDLLQIMSKLDERYAVAKLALNQLIADCATTGAR